MSSSPTPHAELSAELTAKLPTELSADDTEHDFHATVKNSRGKNHANFSVHTCNTCYKRYIVYPPHSPWSGCSKKCDYCGSDGIGCFWPLAETKYHYISKDTK